MRQLIIIVLMVGTVIGFLMVLAGNSAGCLVSILLGLPFLILAARNGRKQQEEWHKPT